MALRNAALRNTALPIASQMLAVLALLALPAAAQERVAQLSQVTGEVSITRAEDGRVDQALQVGPRVRGGSVYADDVVATGAGASATMVFSDGSRIELSESTRLTVRGIDLSKLVGGSRADRPIGRRIKLLVGAIYTEIVENPQIATEFETPSGVVAVKGTRIRLSVSPGAV